jgi:hypothetical protein
MVESGFDHRRAGAARRRSRFVIFFSKVNPPPIRKIVFVGPISQAPGAQEPEQKAGNDGETYHTTNNAANNGSDVGTSAATAAAAAGTDNIGA